MEYPIGIEMTQNFLSYELAKSALKLVRDVMLIKAGENVVITGDTTSDMRILEATANAVQTLGANPVSIITSTGEIAYTEPVKPIGKAVAVADVWIEFSYTSIMLSPSFQNAMSNGCRYINLTGMDVIMMTKTIGKVDYMKMVALGEKLKGKLEKANEVLIEDSNGTKLHAFNQGRPIRHSGQLATQKGYPIMLGGQISWCPIEETINGTLVFDAAVFPPVQLGLIKEPIYLTFEKGLLVDIKGGKEAQVFSDWLKAFHDPNMYRLAHYSLGFNPGVEKATGRIVEDERIFGCMEFGIGSQGKAIKGAYWTAKSHTDGVVSKPSIILDGNILEQNGIYVDPEIHEICKDLKVPGY